MLRRVYPIFMAAVLAGTGAACGLHGAGAADRFGGAEEASRPGQPCGGPAGNLLTPRWQQCWFTAPGGHWRTLHHDLHYDSLVVHVEAATLNDAQAIAQTFIDNQPRFEHLTVYVYQEPAETPGNVRRVSWERGKTFEFLDYSLANP